LSGYGFDRLGLRRVEAEVDPRNQRSVKLLERLRFTREGYLREHWSVGASSSDSALYGLLEADWRATSSGAMTSTSSAQRSAAS
jgi:RimJ/RimL family protein N-acetyltransferase